MSCCVQKRNSRCPTFTGSGATIVPAFIQACKVCRDTPAFFAASAVVKVFAMGATLTMHLTLCQVIIKVNTCKIHWLSP